MKKVYYRKDMVRYLSKDVCPKIIFENNIPTFIQKLILFFYNYEELKKEKGE